MQWVEHGAAAAAALRVSWGDRSRVHSGRRTANEQGVDVGRGGGGKDWGCLSGIADREGAASLQMQRMPPPPAPGQTNRTTAHRCGATGTTNSPPRTRAVVLYVHGTTGRKGAPLTCVSNPMASRTSAVRFKGTTFAANTNRGSCRGWILERSRGGGGVGRGESNQGTPVAGAHRGSAQARRTPSTLGEGAGDKGG